ncbi:MAG: rSAM/selenodomain-associated transferase 1 [Arcticibacterium sp.]
MENALLIFIKNPQLGKAKTRLAATIGKEKALEVYLLLLDHTRKVAMTSDAQKHLYYSEFIDDQDDWSNDTFVKHLQDQNPDLGQKMYTAFSELAKSGVKKALIIGSDCLELTPEIVNSAFKTLDQKDAIIGPAKDGGYYSMGFNFQNIEMEAVLKKAFLGKKWSHDHVLKEAKEALESFSVDYALLPTLSDVDVEADVAHLLSQHL